MLRGGTHGGNYTMICYHSKIETSRGLVRVLVSCSIGGDECGLFAEMGNLGC